MLDLRSLTSTMSSTSARTISDVIPAGGFDRNALRKRVAAHRKSCPLVQVVHRRIQRGLHADDLDIRA